MQIDPSTHSTAVNYKLLTNLIVPRPIAWVTSLSEAGVVNLAPFSFFNAVCADPLYLIISIGRRDDGTLKDTMRNIQTRQGFVVNLVTEALLGAMNVSAAEFPPDQSELEATGLQLAPSERVKAPRLAAAQVSLECVLDRSIALGESTIFIGEVVMFHVDDQLVDDRLRIHGFQPLGRLGSPSVYCRTIDRFDLPPLTHAQWKALSEDERAAALLQVKPSGG